MWRLLENVSAISSECLNGFEELDDTAGSRGGMNMRPRSLETLWLVPLLAVASLGAAGSDSSPVAQAAQNRDHARVRALLEQHVDVNVPTTDGTTALHWAVHWNDLETAVLLIRAGANVNAANRYGATPLWMASMSDTADLVERLLNAGADRNTTGVRGEWPVMVAARAGRVDAVRTLLAHGADVDAKETWRGQTALMWAVGGHESHPDVVRVLLEHGADVHIRSTGGLTALLFAVRQNDLESTRLLVEAGANVDEKAPGETRALQIAIFNNHYDLAEWLLDNGADPNAADHTGFTPLHAAVQERAGGNPERGDRRDGTSDDRSTRLLKSLLAHGANPNARTPSKRRPKSIAPSSRPEIDNVEYGGATPLWIEAHLADLEAMRILVAAGADPRLPSMENTTPFMVAAGLGYGTRGPTSRLGGRSNDTEQAVIAALTQLLEWGNDINAVNDNGQTALHGAASAAAPGVVEFLVDHGARLDQKDAIGRRPVDVADDNRTDKYRSNQALDHTLLEPTYALLRKLGGEGASQ